MSTQSFRRVEGGKVHYHTSVACDECAEHLGHCDAPLLGQSALHESQAQLTAFIGARRIALENGGMTVCATSARELCRSCAVLYAVLTRRQARILAWFEVAKRYSSITSPRIAFDMAEVETLVSAGHLSRTDTGWDITDDGVVALRRHEGR